MIEKLKAFVQKHDSFIITTHDPADADGLGAELTVACILQKWKKTFRIINASSLSPHYQFMDTQGKIEQWDESRHGSLPEQSAMIIVDTAEVNNIGSMKEAALRSNEVFVIDHHEPKPGAGFSGIIDSAASSSCEQAVELAEAADILPDKQTAFAAYTGIVFDTGFFAYSKTGQRAFKAAVRLLSTGIDPSEAYRRLCENSSTGALMLQKKAFKSLSFHNRGRIAAQILRKEDFLETGTRTDDTEGFVNVPLKSRDILVSILVKEYPEGGKTGCSIRSKGSINVAKIAHEFGGGGHINASGYKSNMDVDSTLTATLSKISEILDKP